MTQEENFTGFIIGQEIKDVYTTDDFVNLPDGSKFRHEFLVIELRNGIFIRFPLGENVAIGVPELNAPPEEPAVN